MSFGIFKQNMTSYMSNQRGIQSYQDFAKMFTLEYDGAIRRGYQIVNNVSVLKPNTELMENILNLSLLIALQKQKGLHDIINQFGSAIEGYWIGATLNNFPIPIIPATGAFQNIQTTSAFVTKPGEFPDMKQQYPTNDIEQFLDMLIIGIKTHLFTLEGVYNTISLYPGFPSVPPAPGILQWVGYDVPNTKSAPIVVSDETDGVDQTPEKSVETLLEEIPNDNNTVEGATPVVNETGRGIIVDTEVPASPQLITLQNSFPDDTQPIVESESIITEETEVIPEEVSCGVGLNYEANISTNFKLRNVSLDALFPHKIKNQRGLSVDDIVCNLENVAKNLLEPIKSQWPNVRINSAFRGTPSLSGGRVSQHEKGEAIDIQIPGLTPKQYLPVAKWITENTSFDQLIFEHGKSIWLHISTKRTGVNRKRTMTMLNGKYALGIRCHYS